MSQDSIPKLSVLTTGASFKVYEVTGKAGMQMPAHYSTKEAVVNVREGAALLTIQRKELLLERESVVIIPAGEVHSLHLKSDFKAFVVMELDSKIEFAEQ